MEQGGTYSWPASEEIVQGFSRLPKNSSQIGRESFSYDTALLLMGLGLEKYVDVFKANDVSIEIFMGLDEADLRSLGIDDEEERKKILSHIRSNASNHGGYLYPPENAAEDSLIIRNIRNHSILLDNQLKQLLELLKYQDLDDYFITNATKAGDILKLMTEKAVKQTDKICDSINNSRKESLIDTILQINNMTLPKHMRDKLTNRLRLRKEPFLWLLIGLGACASAYLFGEKFSKTS